MNPLLLFPFVLFGATCTLARSINVEDASLLEFINVLDADGDEAVSLQVSSDDPKSRATGCVNLLNEFSQPQTNIMLPAGSEGQGTGNRQRDTKGDGPPRDDHRRHG